MASLDQVVPEVEDGSKDQQRARLRRRAFACKARVSPMRNIFYLFGQLSDADVDWMIRNGQKMSVSAGQELIKAGREIDAVFIVLEGHLSVTTKSGEVARLTQGEIVGEMQLVDSRPTSATVKALDAVRVLKLPEKLLVPKLERDFPFAARFYRGVAVALSDRLRTAQGEAEEARSGQKSAELDELNPELLDTMHLAGARFNRLLGAVLED
ncbi:MAG: cyclic nucleotide-binding domain-containing protein [Deltaproteobacteria bacterium]|nr:cyclic nucleotide-binding domain-containing protein [Deltaproteobacteria bacterium]